MKPIRTFQSPVTIVAFAIFCAGVAACSSSSPTGPSSAPYSQTDLVLGTGAEAVTGQLVTVNYTGWLYDPTKPDFKGLQFSTSLGGSPFTFTLGSGQVIAGWDRGVPGMQEGGTAG